MQYDKQIVLSIPTGNEDAKQVVRDAAQNLHNKHADTSTLVEWDTTSLVPGLEEGKEVAKLTANSRLYIVGHGDASGKTVAGMDGKGLADCLVQNSGLKAVKRISLAACYAGRGEDQTLIVYDTFAENFHWQLGKKHGLKTEVTARTGRVRVTGEGRKEVRWSTDEQHKHKAKGSKLLLTWDGDTQVTRDVY